MLVYVFSCVLLVSPLLQAVFDLPLQLAFQQALLLAFLAWVFVELRGADLRALFHKKFLLLWCAAGLSLVSLLLSPFKGHIFNEWGNYAAGLLIFVYSSFLDKESRRKTDTAVLAGGWLLAAFGFAQFFILGDFVARPPLTNLNALALYCVLVVPLALERRSWALAALLSVMVIWTQSIGAVLAGLAGAGFYAWSRIRSGEGAGNKPLLAGLLVLVIPVFYLLQADSMAGRLAWWKSAWDMFLARPLAGFGHASFTWAQAGFQGAGAFREYSIYAHNYYLEFLSENGILAAAAWFAFLWAALRRRSGLVKYSVIAALAHSVMDFGLSVPAVFWLFCYLLAEPGERPAAAAGKPSLFPAAAVLLLEAALLLLNFRSLAFERARREAAAAALRGDAAAAEEGLRPYLASRLFRVPALELLGRLNSVGAADRDRGFSSAVYYEMALLENPYSAAAWRALERAYASPGLERAAAGLAARKAGVYK
ncbi:MAG TPA: hypothetical protein DCZ92_13265 [Elusimicrobia bacterium]|nr:MAG: hypothetical protein A2016_02300 [Elusimicrobia bacterium GWF2_62_30]HBA61752.1 hypothetical protein [Elusimicrobiota bacterium]